MVKIFLHKVTTHKIQINTNDANFIDSQILQSPSFHYMPQPDTSLIKEMSTLLLPFFSPCTQLFFTSLRLLGAFSGKVPCSITTKTYYFWQVSRFPFWTTVGVVPWLLAPVTGDMTQVLPGIQSTSLPGLFHNQGFYFLWVIFYFLCREFY